MGNQSSAEFDSTRKKIFEKYSPYQILGVRENENIESILPKYKQLLRKYHPDKGGDPKKFMVIQNAFTEILNRQDSSSHEVMKKSHHTAVKNMKAPVCPLAKSSDFDNEEFNKYFDNNKLSDVTFEHGYGNVDWNQYDTNKSSQYEIKPYEEINYNVQSNLNGQFLDSRQVSDYSNYPELNSNKSTYTDFYRAYTDCSTILPDSHEKIWNEHYKEYHGRSLEKIKEIRESNTKLTEQETEYMKNVESRNKTEDDERQKRWKEWVDKQHNHYNKIHSISYD